MRGLIAKIEGLIATLSFLASIAKSQGSCNTTEFFSKALTSSTIRSVNRCNSVSCLYHSDCQSQFCLKMDSMEQVAVEGVCAVQFKDFKNCSLTVADIT